MYKKKKININLDYNIIIFVKYVTYSNISN